MQENIKASNVVYYDFDTTERKSESFEINF